jgi:transposase
VRVGIEATGHARWFERLLAELKFELWIGDPARIKAARVRKQKTDRQDAQLLLRLLIEGRFPQIWVPSPENRDLRQLIWHRHRLVQMRTRAMNQIQAAAMNKVSTAQKDTVEQDRTKATGGTPACSVGHTAPTGPAGVGGSIEGSRTDRL